MSIKSINGILLILLSCAICTGIIVYTMMLSSLLKVEEEKNMNRWAMATKMLTVPNDNGNTDFTLALQTVQDNTTIPVVVTDSAGNIITSRNLSDEELSEEQMLSIYSICRLMEIKLRYHLRRERISICTIWILS